MMGPCQVRGAFAPARFGCACTFICPHDDRWAGWGILAFLPPPVLMFPLPIDACALSHLCGTTPANLYDCCRAMV